MVMCGESLWNRSVWEHAGYQIRVKQPTWYLNGHEHRGYSANPWRKSVRDLGLQLTRGFLHLFGYNRPLYDEMADKLIGSFYSDSMPWLELQVVDQQEIFRARSLCHDVREFICSDGHVYPRGYSYDAKQYSMIYEDIQSDGCSLHSCEFPGLVLQLATTFRGSVEWLGQSRTRSSAFLLSNIYKALGSSVVALHNQNDGDISRFESSMQMRKFIIVQLSKDYGLTLKNAALGDLKGCLIGTRFGSSVYVNDALPFEQKEWVTFHELGHFLLHSRSNFRLAGSGGKVHPESSEDLFLKRESEANGFADLWQHVIQGLVDHLHVEGSQVEEHTPAHEEAVPKHVCGRRENTRDAVVAV